MRYLGGKTQIARRLAIEVNKYRRDLPVFEPFCGSLAMSVALGGRVACADGHPALIALYQAVAAGWDPPETLSKAEWLAAKALPASNPLNGFAGFGCSFRGCYFAGYAGGYVGPMSNPGAQAARQVLLRDVRALVERDCEFLCRDFFDFAPVPGFALYLDPPYRGTSGYKGAPAFDHDRFYARVEEWARFGPVCVSEYDCPIGRVVWEHSRARKVGGTGRALERLYVVG